MELMVLLIKIPTLRRLLMRIGTYKLTNYLMILKSNTLILIMTRTIIIQESGCLKIAMLLDPHPTAVQVYQYLKTVTLLGLHLTAGRRYLDAHRFLRVLDQHLDPHLLLRG